LVWAADGTLLRFFGRWMRPRKNLFVPKSLFRKFFGLIESLQIPLLWHRDRFTGRKIRVQRVDLARQQSRDSVRRQRGADEIPPSR